RREHGVERFPASIDVAARRSAVVPYERRRLCHDAARRRYRRVENSPLVGLVDEDDVSRRESRRKYFAAFAPLYLRRALRHEHDRRAAPTAPVGIAPRVRVAVARVVRQKEASPRRWNRPAVGERVSARERKARLVDDAPDDRALAEVTICGHGLLALDDS